MTTAVKKNAEPDLALVADRVVEIKPANVRVNDAGQCWRSILVRMPEGATQDDLRNPKIWKLAQGNPQCALIALDSLLILAFDESWAARAVVTHATGTEAHLAIERVLTFREKGVAFYTDGTLAVYWDGGAYGVRRVADGQRVISEGFSKEELAISALRSWYPKRAG